MHVGPRLAVAAIARVVFLVALVVVIGCQLALMSVLDDVQAREAARTVAESPLAAELVDDAVRSAVSPAVGEQLGADIARQASTDPRVADLVRRGLVEVHGSIVDPGAVRSGGSGDVDAVLRRVLDELGTQAGADLDGVREQVGVPSLDPQWVPRRGVRPIAVDTRSVAVLVAVVAAAIVVLLHPRRGRALAGLGVRAAITCGAWVVVLIAVTWLIESVDATLFGRLLGTMWTSTSPEMMLTVTVGAVLGLVVGFLGLALERISPLTTAAVRPSRIRARPALQGESNASVAYMEATHGRLPGRRSHSRCVR